jgi:predicted ATP-grasp superfamily ATP-dependent carboligase
MSRLPLALYVGAKANLDLDMVARGLGFPAVIKPTDHGNGQGVAIVHSREDALRRVVNNSSYQYRSLMVQQFIQGPDIDCSVLAHEGTVALAAVQIRRGSRIEFVSHRHLIAACSRLIAQARYTGLAHFDARLDARDGTVKLVECNPRVWASISAAARCGLNFVAKGIDISMGRLPGEMEILDRGYYINPTRLISQVVRGREWSALVRREVLAGLWQAVSDPIMLIQEEIATHRFATRIQRELNSA